MRCWQRLSLDEVEGKQGLARPEIFGFTASLHLLTNMESSKSNV